MDTGNCGWCKKSFKINLHELQQKFCSAKCKKANYYNNHKEARLKYRNKYYYEHQDECIEKSLAWRLEHPGVKYPSNRNYNPKKAHANYLLCYAVRMNRITRPNNCDICNNETLVFGHHENYEKPYDVKWLCRKCHGKAHRKNEIGA
jgi:hypothetical protein